MTTNIILEPALTSLSNKFATKKIKQICGLKHVNLKDPTIIPTIFNSLRQLEKNNETSALAQTNISFYNVNDKTIDILQPFYFAPATKEVDFEALVEQLDTIPKFIRSLYIEPSARMKALAKSVGKEKAQALDSVEVYQQSNALGITKSTLGLQIIKNGTIREKIANNVAQFLKVKPSVIQDSLNPTEIKIDYYPKIIATPRWGYFIYKLSVSKMESSFKIDETLSNDAIDFLTGSLTGKTFGTAEIHRFLASLAVWSEKTSQLTIKIDDIEKRLPQLTRKSIKYEQELRKANKTIYAGKTEKGAKIQKSAVQQMQSLKSFPTFIKTSLIEGTATPDKFRSTENLLVQIQTDKKGLSSVIMADYVFSGATTEIVISPTIVTKDDLGKEQEIKLFGGKVSLLEQSQIIKIDKAVGQIGLENFAADVQAVLDMLKTKTSKSSSSNIEFLAQEKSIASALIYVIATIIRDGIKEGKLDIEGVPEKIQKSVLKKKKLKPLTDFSDLGGPYYLGWDSKKTPVVYTPDYPKLLKQLRWLTINKGYVALNYDFLQIKRFSRDTHQVISNYGPPEYSYIMSLDKPTFDDLIKTKNYKDFFDLLYKYPIFYKAGVPPSISPSKSKKSKKVVETRGDGPFSGLSQKEKDQLLEVLYDKRYQMVEQAFGGSGCIQTAIKAVDTVDELYENIVDKGNWALFVVQAIDRFKCELSKLGGGDLSCLADFDVIGTYAKSLKAVDIINNFPEFLEKEIESNPDLPVLKLISQPIPSMPSLDWYKCLRAFLLSLMLKIIMDLIIGFIQSLLSLLDIQCNVDFESCQQSDLDPNSSDINEGLTNKKGELAAAGITPQNLEKVAAQISKLIDTEITPEKVAAFIRFLATQMPIANFKALLNDDTPIHIFSHGKFLANNFFFPLKFEDEQLRAMLNIINASYEFEAFIAATLFEQISIGEDCPPSLIDGNKTIELIKNALKEKIMREYGTSFDSEVTPNPDDLLEGVRVEVEKRVSAFCTILSATSGVLNEINSAPALLAGFSEDAISRSVAQMVTQLRIKPHYDFWILKYLYTGSLFGSRPDKEDMIRADLSLAYNVLYRNYWISQVKNGSAPEARSYKKQFNLQPEVFRGAVRWQGTEKILKGDTFEKEFLQDMLKVVVGMNPFLFPLYDLLEASLLGVPEMAPIRPMEQMLLGASRELNNPNYFYAWAENILALLPAIDPRRFPSKYKDFVDDNYPNADKVPFVLSTNFDSAGLRYKYDNGDITLLELNIGLTDFTVSINNDRDTFTRDLPKLSEPFFVDETQDYKSMLGEYKTISNNAAPITTNPQQQIYNSLVEKALVELDLYKNPKIKKEDKNTFEALTISTFEKTYKFLEDEFKASLENADKNVANFFFQPYIKAQEFSKSLPAPDSSDAVIVATVIAQLQDGQLGNPIPPAALFFERSDNILSDIFFEDSVLKETDKLVQKIKATLKDFYKNMTDGEIYDPNVIADLISESSDDTRAFYEFQKLASTKVNAKLGLLGVVKYSPTHQEAILAAVKEITDE
jgi:hypothetical protein